MPIRCNGHMRRQENPSFVLERLSGDTDTKHPALIIYPSTHSTPVLQSVEVTPPGIIAASGVAIMGHGERATPGVFGFVKKLWRKSGPSITVATESVEGIFTPPGFFPLDSERNANITAQSFIDPVDQNVDVVMLDPDDGQEGEIPGVRPTALSASDHASEQEHGDDNSSDMDIYDWNAPFVGVGRSEHIGVYTTKHKTAESSSPPPNVNSLPTGPTSASKLSNSPQPAHDSIPKVIVPKAITPPTDLLSCVKGMYRILDLVNEQASGGLVDKILIAQDSLQDLINDLQPGAQGTSLSHIDFKALDNLLIKPIGIYGSREEISRFLLSIGAVDDKTSTALCAKKSGLSQPTLRSGLYVVRSSFDAATEARLYVIYWPEETTWDDKALSSVCRNRVTFMRYITKITDQVVALISAEHANAMVWEKEAKGASVPDEGDGLNRLFLFNVAKINEQEEDVTARLGFTMDCPIIKISKCVPNGVNNSLAPILLAGETVQAIMTRSHCSLTTKNDFFSDMVTRVYLRDILMKGAVRLGEDLSDDAIEELVQCALLNRFPELCNAWRDDRRQSRLIRDSEVHEGMARLPQDLVDEESKAMKTFTHVIVRKVHELYPHCSAGDYDIGNTTDNVIHERDWADKMAMFPAFRNTSKRDLQLTEITSKAYKTAKKRAIYVTVLLENSPNLPEAERQNIVLKISESKDLESTIKSLGDLYKDTESIPFVSYFYKRVMRGGPSIEDAAKQRYSQLADPDFIVKLHGKVVDEPFWKPIVDEVLQAARSYLQNAIQKLVKKLTQQYQSFRENSCKEHIRRSATRNEEGRNKAKRLEFIRKIKENSSVENASSKYLVVLDSLEVCQHRWPHNYNGFKVTGRRETRMDPAIDCTISILEMSEDDRHTLRLDPSFIPSPRMEERRSHSFRLPLTWRILHVQMLANARCLLVVSNPEISMIYCDYVSFLDGAIKNKKAKKNFHHDKIGEDFLLAFDETKRMLAICTAQKQLHVFVFDENFTSLQALGGQINLSAWYNEEAIICRACFVCGNEEILLIDSSAQGRIFSLLTQQFRPAVLDLKHVPSSIYSSPDGSCLFTSTDENGLRFIRAYHWSAFGSTDGIPLRTNIPSDSPLVLTSLVNRKSVHFISLDVDARRCQSVALDIKGRLTEFMFKETGTNRSSNSSISTAHNCLIDCHAEVWTRFPVIPAIRRQTVTASSKRLQKSLTFVTDINHDAYQPHFSDLVHSFQRSSKKPVGEELVAISVQAESFGTFLSRVKATAWTVTCLRAGEWLVDILCLIPIHLAVTRENKFIPLKDGVLSADLERSLLGADVGQIVDRLSFGWYESLFQSYMASKPVRVVSSMGEQSVGKSYALNHLVDTSFAGSAMRTTEGVWMSVTPTEEALIVALDFEGVHSIERSAQEDTLLVLFNTAISNLVLFRNNFALSRDITGLFQSFQLSSAVLDPAANPSLFKSTLMIIIKDVVDSDKEDIVREFSLKFQRIVQDEQDSNFITKLHGGKLNIIPWPVIESADFYKLFPLLKRRLYEQELTHNAAGEFLLTLKTLMAKLKANDWGALSQTLAAHRAQRLSSLLPHALAFGVAEVEPILEPLKNLDTDEVIDKEDTPSNFFLTDLTQSDTLESSLSALQIAWPESRLRQEIPDNEWTSKLSSYLDHLVELRVEHVREWITCNLSRFKTSHENVEALRRSFEGGAVDLKESVQLCKMQCQTCHLFCIRSRHHDGQHDCRTSHQCIHFCGLCDGHESERQPCGLNSGHPGNHICEVNTHLCGEPCKLRGRPGCLKRCMKPADHTEMDHMCSAPVHACGAPCDLKDINVSGIQRFSCNRTCMIPSDKDHVRHTCDSRMCPISCQLCKRLCSTENHLHGLAEEAVHLCGEEHSCLSLCSAQGTCEIETAPHSIEATFTGKHATFQYTKYTQDARRRQCVVPIPPGSLYHGGKHTHSTDEEQFHFCENRCQDCGYFCVLPKGHPQQEHETSHGSMSKTRWVVDGPDSTFELDGRKFATNDDGAPMMCNIVCQTMGRHAHVDYCREEDGVPCSGPQIQHIQDRIAPHPERAKDWITHSLYWRRSGFKDPYSREDQANFAKCDAMCRGPEHSATASTPAQPSYCTLPIFHVLPRAGTAAGDGMGYTSSDGHVFSCRNPAVMQQAFHVIFVIDRSSSMSSSDRRPLINTPVTGLISRTCNNRLGAVYSSLHGFWVSRAAVTANQADVVRRDAYSIILFDREVTVGLSNNFASSPEQLLNAVLAYRSGRGTNYTAALQSAREVMERNWSTERTPVIIFLSDGVCTVADRIVRDLCRAAVARGKAVSFHAVSFGPNLYSASLRRMARIASEVQNNAPRDPLVPATAIVPSSYSAALDTIQLAETFLGIAESLRKPRGSLIR